MISFRTALIMTLPLLAACAGSNPAISTPEAASPAKPHVLASEIRETTHRDGDDLLTAGLGMAGLRGPAPRVTDMNTNRSMLLRRLAIHANYKGLMDLTATGGFDADATLPEVPGREFQAFARLDSSGHPFRLLLQLPDSFAPESPCLVVAPSSGSRGIYGGLPVAGPWALPRGCAVAYTDKGAGTDLFDHASDTGVMLDGTRAPRGSAALGFAPGPVEAPLVSVPHAHSGDNPEADWGRHAVASAQFGLDVLGRAFPDHAPFSAGETRVVLAAISNGGNAALRGLERAGPTLFDAAVVAAPNVTAPGARHLYDYATEAALLQPCLLADPETLMQLPFGNSALLPVGQRRCKSLHQAGLIAEPVPAAARSALEAAGFEPGALEQAAVNTALDVWRSVAAMYASAYLKRPVDDMPCGFGVAVTGDDENPQAAGKTQRGLWWAASSGVVPGAGVEWIDSMSAGISQDPQFAGLMCLRRLWTGDDHRSLDLREAVRQTYATAKLPDIPVLILHGRQDGLIPVAFSTRPYLEAARENGAGQLAYWEIDGAQHFDVIVPFPGVSNRYRPLLPYVWDGLDHVFGVLDGSAELGGDRVISAME